MNGIRNIRTEITASARALSGTLNRARTAPMLFVSS